MNNRNKKLTWLVLVLLLPVMLIWIYMSGQNEQLTGRQRAMKMIYPLIMRAGKWFGAKASQKFNPGNRKPPVSLYQLHLQLNDGRTLDLSTLKGKKLLLVNTASDCGYTAQYESLQELHTRMGDRLVVIGFPANDFKEQERGSDAEIAQFCKVNFGVSFPLVKKSRVVKGEGQHPVYQWLTDPSRNGWCSQSPEWNFSKYLVNEEGVLTNYFAPGISPLDEVVIQAINE